MHNHTTTPDSCASIASDTSIEPNNYLEPCGGPEPNDGIQPNDYLESTCDDAPSFPAKPCALTVNFEGIPAQLKESEQRQFVLWRYERKDGKWTKVPYTSYHQRADVRLPQTWCSLAEAQRHYEHEPRRYDGIGTVLGPHSDIVGIDMDHQLGPDGGWSAAVQEQIESLGTYGEVSPGGEGVHFFGRGQLLTAGSKRGDFEVYDTLRYLTLTGHRLEGTPEQINACQSAIDAFQQRYILAGRAPRELRTGLNPQRSTPAKRLGDDEIIGKASAAKNGSLFVALFHQDTTNPGLARYNGDHSAMDMAFCVLLAFWSGGEAEQMDRLFRRSALMRSKWDARHRGDGATYGQLTLEAALAVCDHFYDPDLPIKIEPPSLELIESLMESAVPKSRFRSESVEPESTVTAHAGSNDCTDSNDCAAVFDRVSADDGTGTCDANGDGGECVDESVLQADSPAPLPKVDLETGEAAHRENLHAAKAEEESLSYESCGHENSGDESFGDESRSLESSTEAVANGQQSKNNDRNSNPWVSGLDELPLAFAELQLDDEHPALSAEFVLHCLEEEEDGDAKILHALYRGRLLFDPNEKAWYAWRGHYWGRAQPNNERRLVTGQVAWQYLNLAAELTREAKSEDSTDTTTRKLKSVDRLLARAKSLRKLSRVKNVIEFAGSHLGQLSNSWDSQPHLLGVQNGVLDLKAHEFRAGHPREAIRTISPTQWRGIDAPCPRFERFLLEILEGDIETVQLLQRIFGVALWGATIEHKLPIFWGAQGRNGKDTLLEVISFVLGPLAGSVSVGVLLSGQKQHGEGPTPFLYDLRGKRLVWASETNEGAKLNSGQVKYITGGGEITARPCHGNPVRFKPTHTALLLTNSRPGARADDSALWSRLLLIPFRMRFVAQPQAKNERLHDLFLLDELKTEAPGILAWMVRGYLDWKSGGLQPPQSVQLETQHYRDNEDSFLLFCEECCDTSDQQAKGGAGELYDAYLNFVGQGAMNRNEFAKRLAERFTRVTLHGRKVYLGIQLLKD